MPLLPLMYSILYNLLTGAGAQFGYGLVWVIVLAHVVKHPFVLMGPLYPNHTCKSILFRDINQLENGPFGLF
jgi:hypothetical protein